MNFAVLFLRSWTLVLILASTVLAADTKNSQMKQGGELPPESRLIDKWRGTWDVKATRHHPEPAGEVTYVETYDWVLDDRYLRGETSRKSDGSKTMTMIWYNVFTKNYSFVFYDSSGLAVLLPPPTWNEDTQTMEWKADSFSPLSFNGYARFTDPDTIQWRALWKDWKGTVIMDLEGTSVRRK